MDDKDKKRLIITLTLGAACVAIAAIFFYLYFNALMNWDISSGELPFGYMIVAVILLAIGMLVCMIPNQMSMAKWGIKKSMEAYKEAMDETGMSPGFVPGMIMPGQVRMCPKCGRQIPFDANLCPYCGYDFI